MENLSKIEELINDNARTLVGILTKRLENLQLPKDKELNFEQLKCLYFTILKDSIYENKRFLIKLIQTNLTVGDKLQSKDPSIKG
jgi:hypothetical protein